MVEEDDKKTNEADGEGKKPDTHEKETDSAIPTLDRAEEIVERRERVLKKETELQDRKEALRAKEMVGGDSDAGQAPEKKKKLTDEEYSDAMEKGEVDPFAEDGF